MKKKNNSGFAMAEILALTIVIMIIFASIYANFMPTQGEYERRIEYNNVSSQYAAFYMRKLYLDEKLNVPQDGYLKLFDKTNGCQNINDSKKAKCTSLANELGIEEIILTSHKLSKELKNEYSGILKDYLEYLPKYQKNTWEDDEGWSYNECDENEETCQKKNIYRSLKSIDNGYEEWGDWSTTQTCDQTQSETCQTTTLYRSRTTKPKTTTQICTSGTVVKAANPQYNTVYYCPSGSFESERVGSGVRNRCYTCYSTHSSCEQSTGMTAKCSSGYGGCWYNPDSHFAKSSSTNISGYNCNGIADPNGCFVTVSGSNCVVAENRTTTTCPSGTSESGGACYSAWSSWSTTSCDTNNSNLCETTTGYQSRNKIPDTYIDEWEEWTTDDCTNQPEGTCEHRLQWRDTKDLQRIIIKTKDGYATTALLVKLLNDNKGPICNFNVSDQTTIKIGQKNNYTLTCKDVSGFDMLSVDLTDENFTVVDENNNDVSTYTKILITNNGLENDIYTYNIEFEINEDIKEINKLKLILKENQIIDSFNNANDLTQTNFYINIEY